VPGNHPDQTAFSFWQHVVLFQRLIDAEKQRD
jgi:hypothetical protein